jgi:hypothetical protein
MRSETGMASGTKSRGANAAKGKGGAKGKGARAARAAVVASKPKPWGTILAVVAILALAAGVFTYVYVEIEDKTKWVVSEDNKDPSENIEGVSRVTYQPGLHIKPDQRVAYDQSPPFGGPHDGVWADCTGIVYPTAVRNENMVHALEHGAVWIAYNPDQIKDAQLGRLVSRVEGQPYLMLSPYPGLDRPIALQSWGHQLKVDNADDGRIDDFIKSLRQNQFQNPEPRGRCDVPDPTAFNVASPPPFVAEKPGPDAVTMDGKGAVNESGAENGMTAPPTGAEPPPPTGVQPPPSQ